ncbi:MULTISPECIES: cation:proton antiporter [unclassified Pseudomonas]|uniref:cation:proton antiporter n=1 Tax=unclassified Pseudomonas TaxID=196821 RepID=UPI000CCFE284|nr:MULTISPECIES: cation:proton antiporter [unclassified Pseudomonas]POA52534.1 sodium:proton antiporter [Pseudomonas sp. FW507-12TSA]
MSFTIWVAVLGAVLLILALTSSYLRWLPITTSVVCLALGVLIGPGGGGLLQLDIRQAADWMENLTEVALLFSLFVSGLKLRLPLADRSWWVAFGLAGPVLGLGILGVALVLHVLLDLDWSFALLLGAILAPTDPVLASMVQVNDAQDHDRVRFGLSGEAGLNDGVAFAFVILGVLLLKQDSAPQHWLADWMLYSLLWAIPAGLLCGYGLGHGLGRLTLRLRIRHADSSVSPNDYLSFALIALAYVAAELVHGYGFLSVFAAGLGLRQAEVHASSAGHPPAEHLVQPVVGHLHGDPGQSVHGDVQALEERQVAAGIMLGDMLSFGSLVERAMEVFIVTLLGVVLPAHWDWRALLLGALLFLVVRPLSVLAMPWGALLDRHQRLLLGWFGIRGIGSLYYLFYALNHQLEPAQATLSIQLTLSVVALSILVHGLSTQPLLLHYQRCRQQAERR